MKCVVLNLSGNVGKSTVARHLLAPRIPGASLYLVETINSDGSEDRTVSGKQYGDVAEALLITDHAIVDVGASNIESFLAGMRQRRGSHQMIDYYVVPVVGTSKQIKDTISTIDMLAEIDAPAKDDMPAKGVPPAKIKVVMNVVDYDDDIDHLFAGLIRYAQEERKCEINRDAVIHRNELFGRLRGSDMTIASILADQTDYRAQISAAPTQEEKIGLARKVGHQQLAAGVQEELDQVFAALFGAAAPRVRAGRR